MGKRILLVITSISIIFATAISICGCTDISNETSSKQTISSSESATQKETTQIQTESDYSKVYKAYKNVIEQNLGIIKAYDIQLDSSKSRPIVFADITGDDTPELIFVSSEKRDGYNYALLNIYSYYDENYHLVFPSGDSEFLLQTDAEPCNGYSLFQISGEKNLYISQCRAMTNMMYHVYKLEPDSSDKNKLVKREIINQCKMYMPNSESTGKLLDEDVGYKKCDKYKFDLFDNMSSLLMYSKDNDDSYSEYLTSDKNKAMTYSEAIDFLNKYDDNSSENEMDFSVITGRYRVRKNGMIGSVLEVDTDGTFVEETSGNSGDEYYESVCRGRIVNLTKENDYKYTFYVANTHLENKPGTQGKDFVNDHFITVTYDDNAFDTGKQFTLYLEGTLPANMNDNDFEKYKSWGDDPDSAITKPMICTSDSSIYDYESKIE